MSLLLKIMNWLFQKRGMSVLYVENKYRHDAKRAIKKAKKLYPSLELIRHLVKDILMGDEEVYALYNLVKQTEKIEGDIAEVGVYKGGSAQIICEARGKKPVYLFDTFSGLPSTEGELYKGQFYATYEEVKNRLKDYPNVYIYKGLFPDSAGPIKDKKFSFVHLDVDLSESSIDCLSFFYNRMTKGGMILSHDWGVVETDARKAYEEFFKDKPEIPIELNVSQCVIVKT